LLLLLLLLLLAPGYNKDSYHREGYHKDGYDSYGEALKRGLSALHMCEESTKVVCSASSTSYKCKQTYNIASLQLTRTGHQTGCAQPLTLFADRPIAGYDKHGYDKYGYSKDGESQWQAPLAPTLCPTCILLPCQLGSSAGPPPKGPGCLHRPLLHAGYNQHTGQPGCLVHCISPCLACNWVLRHLTTVAKCVPLMLPSPGYDRSGYDKYGYNKDSYHREGYHKDGYMNGYDKYGEPSIGKTPCWSVLSVQQGQVQQARQDWQQPPQYRWQPPHKAAQAQLLPRQLSP
jgi:hypothetical protein